MSARFIIDWAAHFLGGQDHNAIAPYALQAYRLVSTIKAWTLPMIDSIIQKPDLATIALLLIIILISLKLLNMFVQSVLFWFRMVRTFAFWGGLVALALWMWTRGPEGVLDDVNRWWTVWDREYGYWKEREQLAAMAKGYQMPNNPPLGRQKTRGSWF